MNAPTIGYAIKISKFMTEVRRAYRVASMRLGVILANKVIEGKSLNATSKKPMPASVKYIRKRSSISNSLFHLSAKHNYRNVTTTFAITLSNSMVLISYALKNDW